MARLFLTILILVFRLELVYGQFTYHVPHIVFGTASGDPHDPKGLRAWYTEFQVANPSRSEPVTITINVKNNDGSPLLGFSAPRTLIPTSTVSLTLSPLSVATALLSIGQPVVLNTGWALVEATGPLSVTTVVFDATATCDPSQPPNVCSTVIRVNTSATLVPTIGTDFVLFANYIQPPTSDFRATGIALLNTSRTEMASVIIQFWQQTGTTHHEVALTLPPQTKISKFLHEIGEPAVVFGAARVQSSTPVALAVVEVRNGQWVTTPAAHVQ